MRPKSNMAGLEITEFWERDQNGIAVLKARNVTTGNICRCKNKRGLVGQVYHMQLDEVETDDKDDIGMKYEVKSILDAYKARLTGSNPHFYFIKLIRWSKPVFRKNYRIEEVKKNFVIEKVKGLLEKGVIEESMSQWNSPLVIVKKGSSFRMCLDFRGVNKLTESETCPPPSVDEALYALSQNRYFTKLDLQDGYNQIALDRRSGEITAFTSPIGRFQHVRMPFGLKNAPATFQAVMFVVLSRFIGRCVIVYMDDIVVYSKSRKEHLEDLKDVLEVLPEAGLKLNEKKCKYSQKEVEFLGLVVNGETVKINRERFKGLNSTMKVETVKQLQRALGFQDTSESLLKDSLSGFRSYTR